MYKYRISLITELIVANGNVKECLLRARHRAKSHVAHLIECSHLCFTDEESETGEMKDGEFP